MTDDERIQQVERERRRREAELLALLLLLASQSRRYAVAAVRLGHSPTDALRNVWLGSDPLDLPGLSGALAERMADAATAGVRRVGRWTGAPQGEPVAPDVYQQAAADATAQLTNTLARKVSDATVGLDGVSDRVKAVREAFAGYTVDQPAALVTAATLFVTQAYGDGMRTGYGAAGTDLWGFRYTTMRDDKVRPTHRAMEGVTREVDDPVWNVWQVPAGFGCRCVLLPVPQSRAHLRTETLPDVWPDPGFGFAPRAVAVAVGA